MDMKEGTHVLRIMADYGRWWLKREHTLQIMADGGERGNPRCGLWQMLVKEVTHVADYGRW